MPLCLVVADGAGGAIVAWRDHRSGTNYAVYAQRINGAGAPQWTSDGVVLSPVAPAQDQLAMVADGSGGSETVTRKLVIAR